MNRFRYELAERNIDTWVFAQESQRFKRAYAKFKLTVIGMAMVDYLDECGQDREMAIGRAWEHVHITLTGHGTEDLSGSLALLFRLCDDRTGLLDAFERGIAAAIEATEDYRWLYRPVWREKPLLCPIEDGLNGQILVPAFGPHLRDWATAEGMDEKKVEMVVEMMLREAGELTATPKPHLTLL